MAIDPELVRRIDRLGVTGFDGEAFRHVSPDLEPLSTTGARIHGGRWNPPERFGALYLALDVETVAAELRRTAASQNLELVDLLPRTLYRFHVRAGRLLDLTSPEAAAALDLSPRELHGRVRTRCQAVGAAAHYLSVEGILAPSAAGPGSVLALYPDRLGPEAIVEPVEAITGWVPPPPAS